MKAELQGEVAQVDNIRQQFRTSSKVRVQAAVLFCGFLRLKSRAVSFFQVVVGKLQYLFGSRFVQLPESHAMDKKVPPAQEPL